MLQQILLLTIPTTSTKAMVVTTIPSNLPGPEFSIKLRATRTANLTCFGSIVKTETCIYPENTTVPENPGFGAATKALFGNPIPHWCLQDFMEVTHNNNNTLKIPSGCSFWVKEVDAMPIEKIDVSYKTGIRKLSELRNQTLSIPNGNLATQLQITL